MRGGPVPSRTLLNLPTPYPGPGIPHELFLLRSSSVHRRGSARHHLSALRRVFLRGGSCRQQRPRRTLPGMYAARGHRRLARLPGGNATAKTTGRSSGVTRPAGYGPVPSLPPLPSIRSLPPFRLPFVLPVLRLLRLRRCAISPSPGTLPGKYFHPPKLLL